MIVCEQNELIDLVDESIVFNKLTKDKLLNYLSKKNILNKDKILKNSNYEKYNYKNIDKLIKREGLVNN